MHVLVEQYPEHECEGIAAEEIVGGGVLSDAELRQPDDLDRHQALRRHAGLA
jgi:hypothetical protein